MFSFLQSFAHKAEMRESKDEMLVGEIVRAMARKGFPAIMFQAGNDRQRMRFKCVGHKVLHSVYIDLDRKTGGSALQEAILGSKATLAVAAEVKNRIADPDDLVAMYKTDLQNLFKMPVMGGIKLNHELNSVYARTTLVIEIGKYILQGEAGVDALQKLLDDTVTKLEAKLQPYKK